MNAGASLSAVPSPIEGSGTAWVLLGSWALSPARPTPIPPRHECRGFSALLVTRPILGFKSFDAAQDTLVGIELMHMIKKRQMVVEAGAEGLTAAELFYSLAA